MKFHGPKLVDFYYMGFRQAMVKKKNGGGTPRLGPIKILKLQNFQKVTPMTSYNPIFLLQNHLLLSKLGCLQTSTKFVHSCVSWKKLNSFKQSLFIVKKKLFKLSKWFKLTKLNKLSKLTKIIKLSKFEQFDQIVQIDQFDQIEQFDQRKFEILKKFEI